MFMYSFTKDAKTGRNKPTLLSEIFTGQYKHAKGEYETFSTPEAYLERRAQITKRG